MRWSRIFIPTRKEVPKEAESVSHKLMLRAGLIEPQVSGVYTYLPLGWRVLKKIQKIMRREMDRIGAQELLMPALTPSSIWKESGRWEDYGDEMFRLKDRKESEMALAPTHEEVITTIVRNHIRSHRSLPQIWYQIQTKYRDEMRPRGAVLRARTFIMKDSYSLDQDETGLQKSFSLHEEAYRRIFSSCRLKPVEVRASSGLMGGSNSKEFMVISESGEDRIVNCPNCGYSSNLEVANLLPTPVNFENGKLKKVGTPVEGSVDAISRFLNVPPSKLMKSLLYIKKDKPVWIVIRGDYEVDEEKLKKEFKGIRIATQEEVKEVAGASVGYVSPIGLNLPVIADLSIKQGLGFVSGANEDYYHYTGVDPNRDLDMKKFVDLRKFKKGDLCPECRTPVEWKNAIELGHIFKLGTKYSKAMGAYFIDENGEKKPIVMGSYGIGVERIMASVIEVSHDKNGIIWPASIAPYQILLINLNASDSKGVALCEDLYRLLGEEFEVLYDDRDERAGYKFNDADLIGIPIQIIVGSKGLKKGMIEIKNRKTGEIKKVVSKEVKEVVKKIWGNL